MSERLTNISLFTGAGGLDIGLEQAGFETRVCVEYNQACLETLEANRPRLCDPSVSFLQDITKESPGHILEVSGLKPGEATLVCGGPPCQSYSTAGKRGAIDDPRGSLFFQYAEVIRVAQPRFFIMENVRGLLSAAIKHRPLHLRNEELPLDPHEELGSVFNGIILPKLEGNLDYQVSFGVLNALDYGASQDRRRLIIIGSRDMELGNLSGRPPIDELVQPTHHPDGTKGIDKWKNLRQCLDCLEDVDPEFQKYSDARAEIFDQIPEGKNWRHLRDDPAYGDDYVRQILGGAYGSTGGRVGFWRRLSWDKWAPTLTTSPTQKSTGLCHPELTRPLSVKEYARIQGFPDDWVFAGSTSAKYRQIGNAVAIQVANALGKTIADLVNKEAPVSTVGL